MSGHLNISEIFGPTTQGEGRQAGRLASFIRLSGCNLSCSWCDTPFTWDWSRFDRAKESTRMLVGEVADRTDELPGRLIVSGGEPLVQAKALASLLTSRPDRLWDLETNGTRPLGPTQGLWATISCSPKVGPSAQQGVAGADLDESVVNDPATDFKFVIRDEADLLAAVTCVREHGIEEDRVWLMPEGTTAERVTSHTPLVVEAAVKYGFNVSTRLHVYAWGDERGH